MPDIDKPLGACCCVPPAAGLRMLTFTDGTQAGVFGLDDAFAAVYAQGRQADGDTAESIVDRLAAQNYIAPTTRVKYTELLLEEYGRYVEKRKRQDMISATASFTRARRTGWLARFFRSIAGGA